MDKEKLLKLLSSEDITNVIIGVELLRGKSFDDIRSLIKPNIKATKNDFYITKNTRNIPLNVDRWGKYLFSEDTSIEFGSSYIAFYKNITWDYSEREYP